MHASAALAKALRTQGIGTVFGVMGTGTLQIVHPLVHDEGIRYVAAAREDGAITMADGFARAQGGVGVAMVTYGPAFANTPHSLTEAVRNRTPLLVVAGDTSTQLAYHFQHVDQELYTLPTGAGYMKARSGETLAQDVREAMRRAWTERRPVVLTVPVDFQTVEVEFPELAPLEFARHPTVPDPDALDLVAGMVASANRPLILAGLGAAQAGARDDLIRLGEILGAPLSTTVKGKGMFAGEPYDLGLFGGMATDIGLSYITKADCVIAFGASLNDHTTLEGELLQGKRVIHIDADPESLGRFHSADIELQADARSAAHALVQLFADAELPPSSFRSAQMLADLSGYVPESGFEPVSGEHGLDMRTVMIMLDRLLPAARGVVTDVGHFLPAPLRYLHVQDHRDFLYGASFGSVGLGMSIGIGMAVARPERPTVAVMGDGGLMMSLAEFNTAVRAGADLVVVVLNDMGYGQEWHHLEHNDLDPDLSLFDWPDFAAIATAMGGTGISVNTLDGLEEAAKTVAERDRPVLIDVHVDPRARMGVTD
jgi:thiamine pyrophosphate-dependent acetolactate synthase large subunit-like protein